MSAVSFVRECPQFFAVTGVLILLMAGGWYLQMDDEFEIRHQGSRLVIADPDGRNEISYQLQHRLEVRGRVLSFDPRTFKFSRGAFTATVSYLSEEHYQEFLKIRGCAAAFLNAHAKMLILVPQSESAHDAVRSLKLQRGSRFAIDGSTTRLLDGHLEDFPISPAGWFAGNTIIAVESMQRVL